MLLRIVATDLDDRAGREVEFPAATRGQCDCVDHHAATGKFLDAIGIELEHVAEAVVGAAELRQSLQPIRAGNREQLATPADQALGTPARIGLAFVDDEIDRIGPALARFGAFHPGQCRDRIANLVELDREETVAEQRLRRGANLFGADMIEFRAHVELAHRPAIAREPAVEDADERQRDQGQRDGPGEQLEEDVAAHVPPPALRGS